MFTEEQFAEKLSVPVEEVTRWREAGVGPEYVELPGGTVRYTQGAIDEFLDGHTKTPSPADGMVTVVEYLVGAGLSDIPRRYFSPPVGRRAASMFREVYGRDPEQKKQTLDGTTRRVNAYPREFTPYLALALSTSHGVSSIPAEVVDDVIWRPTNVRKYACISMEPDDVFDVYGQIGPRKWEYQESHDPDDLALGIRGWAIPRPWSNRLRDGLLHPLVLAERDRVAGLGDRATRVEQQWLEKNFGWWLETGEDCPE